MESLSSLLPVKSLIKEHGHEGADILLRLRRTAQDWRLGRFFCSFFLIPSDRNRGYSAYLSELSLTSVTAQSLATYLRTYWRGWRMRLQRMPWLLTTSCREQALPSSIQMVTRYLTTSGNPANKPLAVLGGKRREKRLNSYINLKWRSAFSTPSSSTDVVV